jgi:hypothetical protein
MFLTGSGIFFSQKQRQAQYRYSENRKRNKQVAKNIVKQGQGQRGEKR